MGRESQRLRKHETVEEMAKRLGVDIGRRYNGPPPERKAPQKKKVVAPRKKRKPSVAKLRSDVWKPWTVQIKNGDTCVRGHPWPEFPSMKQTRGRNKAIIMTRYCRTCATDYENWRQAKKKREKMIRMQQVEGIGL